MKLPESREAAFMGRITASVAHEMKNVLAIIKESAGLMEDLLTMKSDAPVAHRERFSRVITSIGQQVARGTALATELNKFAHTTDETLAEVDLNEAVGRIVFLCQRFARSKRISLETRTRQQPVLLSADPMKIQMLLFNCIDMMLGLLGEGEALILSPASDEGRGVKVRFACGEDSGRPPGSDPVASDVWPVLQESARGLQASIERGDPPVWFEVVFNR